MVPSTVKKVKLNLTKKKRTGEGEKFWIELEGISKEGQKINDLPCM